MRTYSLTTAARADIAEIHFYVSEDSAKYADKVQAAIYSNFELLARTPGVGSRQIPNTRESIRVWPALPYKVYRIVYEAHLNEIRVLRVLHSARETFWSEF